MCPNSIAAMQPETIALSVTNWERNGTDMGQLSESGIAVVALHTRKWCSLRSCGLPGALPGKSNKST